MPMARTFRKWVLVFENEENRFGDLARDIKADRGFPTKNNHDAIREYFQRVNACTDCIDSFELAWLKYCRSFKAAPVACGL